MKRREPYELVTSGKSIYPPRTAVQIRWKKPLAIICWILAGLISLAAFILGAR